MVQAAITMNKVYLMDPKSEGKLGAPSKQKRVTVSVVKPRSQRKTITITVETAREEVTRSTTVGGNRLKERS
jgi:hypothetical protein